MLTRMPPQIDASDPGLRSRPRPSPLRPLPQQVDALAPARAAALQVRGLSSLRGGEAARSGAPVCLAEVRRRALVQELPRVAAPCSKVRRGCLLCFLFQDLEKPQQVVERWPGGTEKSVCNLLNRRKKSHYIPWHEHVC